MSYMTSMTSYFPYNMMRLSSTYYQINKHFVNICSSVSCRNYLETKCFKNCENISTYGKVTLKIEVASSFTGHDVSCRDAGQLLQCFVETAADGVMFSQQPLHLPLKFSHSIVVLETENRYVCMHCQPQTQCKG